MSMLLICFFFYTPVWYFTSVIYISTRNNAEYYYTYHKETVIQCYLTEKIVNIVTFMNMLFSCLDQCLDQLS